MKCEKCGFIFNGEKDTCPYCGSKIKEAPSNFLHSSTSLSANTSIKNISIISIILINLFAISFFVDWALGFTYKFTLIGFFLFIGLLICLLIIYKKKSLCSIYMSLDIFLIFLIFLASLFGNFVSTNLIGLFAGVVLPIYMIASTIGLVLILWIPKKKTFSPVWLVLYLFFKVLVGLTLFILGTIYKNTGGNSLAFFDVSNFITFMASTDLVRILCISAFGITALVFINTIVLLLTRVASNIKRYYANKK